ncbi:RHS repeat-associated core domain-containing protein [Paenibacillus turicensis]|uniref:RHS repeat domain-containing protein n=1 Tax=Paenibacillus turicensis TaxID=160487 RepID=UPI003D271D53
MSDGSYLTSDYSYDGIGRLIKVSNKKGTVIVSEFSYVYDNNGNITSIKDSVGTTNYQYDKLNRLIQVKRPSGETIVYTYDARGNRKTLKGDSGMVDSKEQTYTFNLWDQVSKVVKDNTTTEFEYEMEGLRLAKTKTTVKPTNSDQNSNSQNPASSVEKVRYAYNNAGKVISEADANNKAIANYTWGPDRLLAKRDVSTNKKYFYLYNGHGDVVQLIDESGQVVNHYQYDEWGNIVEQEEAVRNDFKYAGEIFDNETGLYYLRARYYDPAIGRFVSKDTYEGTVTNPLSLNLYSYVRNNPLTHVDPSGHDAIMITNPDLAFGLGHTSILIENSDGKWHYFYWGDENVQLKQVSNEYLTDLNKFNSWGSNTKLNDSSGKKVDLAGFSQSGYTSSTYIQGDFSSSYSEAKKLAKSHSIDDPNKDYSLIKRNCYIVSLDLLSKGTLYNGVSASRFTTSVNIQVNSLIGGNSLGGIVGAKSPNIGAAALNQVFYNSAFTHSDYQNQLRDAKKGYESGNWLTKIIQKAGYHLFRINTLLGK